MSEEIMLTEKQQAEALHKQITGYGEVIYQSLYGMCTAIKQMRDSKLYRALGFDTFEGYADNKLGMKSSQVYKYIAIADRLTEDFVHSSGQIGIQKLYLLAMASEETRTEIVRQNDLAETTVKELREQIASMKADAANKDKLLAQAREDSQKSYEEVQERQEEIDDLKARLKERTDQMNDMQAQIDELESRPVEVAVPEPSREVQNMQDAMRRINLEHEQWSAKIQDDHIKHVQEINRQHRAETDALRAEYEEKLAAAQASPAETPEPDSKEIFKAYLANAIDAVKRMTAFLAAHPNEACRAQAERFFAAAMKEVQNEQTV